MLDGVVGETEHEGSSGGATLGIHTPFVPVVGLQIIVLGHFDVAAAVGAVEQTCEQT